MAGPLDGIRVLDWTQFQQGPIAGVMLAQLGAEVIKIEHPVRGDLGRGWLFRGGGDTDQRVTLTSGLPGGKSAYFEQNNRGKKDITVNLLKEKGQEVIYRLVRNSDVFLTNMRQGVPERLKMDYETLRQHNPKLIYACASGYGPQGPEAKEPAFDLMGLARSGMMTMQHSASAGVPNPTPIFAQVGIADQLGGIMTAYGILAALIARDRLGVGQRVDASLLGSMIFLQGHALGVWLLTHPEPREASRETQNNPFWNWYKCQDGKWIALAMGREQYWPTVCQALGLEHLIKDPRFENVTKRAENCRELIAIMDERFLTKPCWEWIKILRAASEDHICTPVQTVYDLIEDPQVLANNYIVEGVHPVLGTVKMLGNPVRLSETPVVNNFAAPEFGQHTEEVLIEVGGYTWEEIAQLREEEVL